MEIKELFTKEISRQYTPLKCDCGTIITSEIISEWAIEIGRKAFESDESMSGGEG